MTPPKFTPDINEFQQQENGSPAKESNPSRRNQPPLVPLAITALLLVFPAATMPLMHFEIWGSNRTFILWDTLKTPNSGMLLVITAFLFWCALGATLLKQLSLLHNRWVRGSNFPAYRRASASTSSGKHRWF